MYQARRGGQKMGLCSLLGIKWWERGERWHVDDIIFPKMDMCLITLAGWFSPRPTKNNFDVWSLIQILAPPWKYHIHILSLIAIMRSPLKKMR